MTKVDIRRLDSVTANDTTATQLINENFTALQEAIENTISRDGTTPNFMDADLDLNSYKIINAGTPTNNTDVITKEYFDEHVGDAAGYSAAAEASANRAAQSAQAAQGYSTAAAGAADVAQRARDFIESDPGFQVVSEDLLLGEDSEIRKVNANKLNIDTVSQSITNVNAVGNDIVSVSTVAADLTNVDTVASNIDNVNNVNNNITNVNIVGNDIANVNAVGNDIANVNAVAADLTNIDATSSYAAEAKQWAIGDPSEPVGNSAKYWAEYAQQETAGVETRVTVIEGKIPSTATSSNKLTDKSYVDSQDNSLQTQIDAIVASSDVYDIVGTYAELQVYDISTVPVNDIIKVLVDETRSGAATYYRCVENNNVKSWSYIGAEGAYYTKGETNTLLSAKQDTLVSGTNIKTINNNSILGSGNLDINGLPTQTGQSGKFLTTDGTDASWADVDALPSQTGQSGKYLTTDGSSASWATLSVNPDNKSITANSSDELQTVGVIDSNNTTNAIKIWTGTKAQRDAIVNKDPNTLYNVTDDTDISLTILESLYPVGSVYITTANTCPLSALISGSTWELVSSGRVLQGADSGHSAGTTIEAGLPNITGGLVDITGGENLNSSGAFDLVGAYPILIQSGSSGKGGSFGFNASRSSSIYGNSTTVQPPAYCVNIYRRTA